MIKQQPLSQAMAVKSLALALFAVLASSVSIDANGAGFSNELADIQHRWAQINYEEQGKTQKKDLEALLEDARAFAATHAERAEAHVWHGIVSSTYAGVASPFSAMSYAKEARKALETAESIDASVLDGSVYTSLGTLYYKVPGGLIGFGDKALARDYLEKALAVNPTGIDPNYFYGELMFEEKQYEAARDALLKAMQAPPRPARPLADQGRKKEIEALMARVERKLGRSG